MCVKYKPPLKMFINDLMKGYQNIQLKMNFSLKILFFFFLNQPCLQHNMSVYHGLPIVPIIHCVVLFLFSMCFFAAAKPNRNINFSMQYKVCVKFSTEHIGSLKSQYSHCKNHFYHPMPLFGINIFDLLLGPCCL